MLSEDDAFNSNPDAGFITYRLPSLTTLMGVPDEFVHQYSTLTFVLTVNTIMGGSQMELECYEKNNCKVKYKI